MGLFCSKYFTLKIALANMERENVLLLKSMPVYGELGVFKMSQKNVSAQPKIRIALTNGWSQIQKLNCVLFIAKLI